MATEDALAYCTDQVRRLDRARYQTTLFAPTALRGVVTALFAFDIEIARIRDLVSEPLLGRIRVQWWRDSVGALFDGNVSAAQPVLGAHPVLESLAPLIRAGDLTHGYFEQLLDARESELDIITHNDLASLVAFAEATSGSLTLLVMEALGHRDSLAQDAARRLGTAWGLACLIRAVPREARAGRVTLPLSLLKRLRVESADGNGIRPSHSLNKVVAEIHNTALELIRDARRNIGELPRSARSGLLLATLVTAVLRDIRRAGFDPFSLALAPPPTARLLWAAVSGRI